MQKRFSLTLALIVVAILPTTVEGSDLGKTKVNECPKKTSPCYLDCCERGLSYCNVKQKRCTYCDNVVQLCGTDSMPEQCLLFCYKRQEADSHTCLSLTTVIVIGIAPVALLSLAIILAIVLLYYFLLNRPPDKWPAFLEKLRLHPHSVGNDDNISADTGSSFCNLSVHKNEQPTTDRHDDRDSLLADKKSERIDKNPACASDGDIETEEPTNEASALSKPGLPRRTVSEIAGQGHAGNESDGPANGTADLAKAGEGSSLLGAVPAGTYRDKIHSDVGRRGTSLGDDKQASPPAESPRCHNFTGMNPTSDDANPAPGTTQLALNNENPSEMYTFENSRK